VVTLLGKVNFNFIALDADYSSYPPGAVKHIVPLVKRDVLFKIGNGLVDIAVALGKIRNAYIVFKLAMLGILPLKTFDDFLAGGVIFFIVL
jgi:hypothetical protein